MSTVDEALARVRKIRYLPAREKIHQLPIVYAGEPFPSKAYECDLRTLADGYLRIMLLREENAKLQCENSALTVENATLRQLLRSLWLDPTDECDEDYAKLKQRVVDALKGGEA